MSRLLNFKNFSLRAVAMLCLTAPGFAVGSEIFSYSGDGNSFDFSIEASDGTATLYIASKPLNEPLTGQSPVLVPDDEKLPQITFMQTNDPGVYSATLTGSELPEGQLEAVISGEKEAVEVYASEQSAGHEEHNGHAHGAARKSASDMLKSGPAVAVGFLGALLIGFIMGRITTRTKVLSPIMKDAHESFSDSLTGEPLSIKSKSDVARKISVIAISIYSMSTAVSKPALASDGHTHDTLEIKTGGSIGQVTLGKKSQFLINLRTKPAKNTPITETLNTLGHLTPKPQLNAVLRSPFSGFVRFQSENLLGSTVRKGQVIGQIEGVTTINLVAPISGKVIELLAVSGTRLEPSESILRVADTSVLWVDAEVFQKDLLRLKGAKSADVLLDGSSTTIPGRVLGVSSAVDEKTLTAKVFVEVDNSAGALPLGGMASVSFELGTTADVGMVFPAGTVLNRGGEKIVYVQTGPETFVAKSVATKFGARAGVDIVTKGLDEGDRVVVSGGYQVLIGAN